MKYLMVLIVSAGGCGAAVASLRARSEKIVFNEKLSAKAQKKPSFRVLIAACICHSKKPWLHQAQIYASNCGFAVPSTGNLVQKATEP